MKRIVSFIILVLLAVNVSILLWKLPEAYSDFQNYEEHLDITTCGEIRYSGYCKSESNQWNMTVGTIETENQQTIMMTAGTSVSINNLNRSLLLEYKGFADTESLSERIQLIIEFFDEAGEKTGEEALWVDDKDQWNEIKIILNEDRDSCTISISEEYTDEKGGVLLREGNIQRYYFYRKLAFTVIMIVIFVAFLAFYCFSGVIITGGEAVESYGLLCVLFLVFTGMFVKNLVYGIFPEDSILEWDGIYYSGRREVTDNPWGYSVGRFNIDENGECFFLTPHTSIILRNLSETKKLQCQLYSEIKEQSDGAVLEVEYIDSTGVILKQESIEIDPSDEWKNFELTNTIQAGEIKISCTGGENDNEICDWVIIREYNSENLLLVYKVRNIALLIAMIVSVGILVLIYLFDKNLPLMFLTILKNGWKFFASYLKSIQSHCLTRLCAKLSFTKKIRVEVIVILYGVGILVSSMNNIWNNLRELSSKDTISGDYIAAQEMADFLQSLPEDSDFYCFEWWQAPEISLLSGKSFTDISEYYDEPEQIDNDNSYLVVGSLIEFDGDFITYINQRFSMDMEIVYSNKEKNDGTYTVYKMKRIGSQDDSSE